MHAIGMSALERRPIVPAARWCFVPASMCAPCPMMSATGLPFNFHESLIASTALGP